MARASKTRTSRNDDEVTARNEYRRAESDALFLSIGEGAILTDELGNISRINNEALRILGHKAEEVIGKWYPEVVIVEDENEKIIPNIDRPITQVFMSGKTVFRRAFFYRKDGTKVAVALTVSPVLVNKKPIGAIEVFRDITEELRLDKARDEFIALASHQLRTPATGVKQYAGMLLEGYGGKLSGQQMTMVKTIYESNERQIMIINELLRIAQLDAGQITLDTKKTDITQLIRDITTEHDGVIQSRSQILTISCPITPLYAEIDSAHMRMALENIVDNASKYSPENKKIFIDISRVARGVKIEVKDQGVGMDKKEIDQIFEKFVRIDNPLSTEVGGTGLGLYWVKKILDLHGAKLIVKSARGKGSTFTITIPSKA